MRKHIRKNCWWCFLFFSNNITEGSEFALCRHVNRENKKKSENKQVYYRGSQNKQSLQAGGGGNSVSPPHENLTLGESKHRYF